MDRSLEAFSLSNKVSIRTIFTVTKPTVDVLNTHVPNTLRFLYMYIHINQGQKSSTFTVITVTKGEWDSGIRHGHHIKQNETRGHAQSREGRAPRTERRLNSNLCIYPS